MAYSESSVFTLHLLSCYRGLPTDRYMWSDATGLQECTKAGTKPPSLQWTWVSPASPVCVMCTVCQPWPSCLPGFYWSVGFEGGSLPFTLTCSPPGL